MFANYILPEVLGKLLIVGHEVELETADTIHV